MLKKDIRTNTLHGSLIRLNKIHRKMAKREFQKVDLTEGKPRLLDFIISNPGCSQREIASCCKIEPATATSILSSMEKEKLIYRERNTKDKRILNVFLTEKGIEAQKKVEKVFLELLPMSNDNKYNLELDEICFDGFSEKERIEAINTLNRLYENLAKKKKE